MHERGHLGEESGYPGANQGHLGGAITVETARERLKRLLESGEVREEEARALLVELERRRAESHDFLWRWMRATQPLLYTLFGAIVVFVTALVVREVRWGEVLGRAAILARRDPLAFAVLALSAALGMYVFLSLAVPLALSLTAWAAERRRLRGGGP